MSELKEKLHIDKMEEVFEQYGVFFEDNNIFACDMAKEDAQFVVACCSEGRALRLAEEVIKLFKTGEWPARAIFGEPLTLAREIVAEAEKKE
jgi:hypothetical protein